MASDSASHPSICPCGTASCELCGSYTTADLCTRLRYVQLMINQTRDKLLADMHERENIISHLNKHMTQACLKIDRVMGPITTEEDQNLRKEIENIGRSLDACK